MANPGYRPLDRLAAHNSNKGGVVYNTLRTALTRTRSRKALVVACVFVILCLLFLAPSLRDPESEWSLQKLPFRWNRPMQKQSQCTPDEYGAGEWIYRPYYTRPGPLTKTYNLTSSSTDSPPPIVAEGDPEDPISGDGTKPPTSYLQNMTKSEDVLTFTRFEACASSREYWWHLAADRPEQFDRFPGPTEWEWVPGGRCKGNPGLRDWDREEVVRELVEGGGWLLVGDSVTENHFFSLSCLLYPHVVGYPDYTKLTSMYDRAWPQHLYLNPASPLTESLAFPNGFNISSTPLVTFRRVDLLWSKDDLVKMHKEMHPEFYEPASDGTPSTFQLFGEEAVWTISPKEYFDIFTKPLPEGNYRTMVVSTAGHWTTNLFHGYKREGEPEVGSDPQGKAKPVWNYDGLVQFYQDVMARWVVEAQKMISHSAPLPTSYSSTSPHPDHDDMSGRLGRIWPIKGKNGDKKERKLRNRKVLVRAYLPGHEDCHKKRSPWRTILPFDWNWWNWAEIWRFNKVFMDLLADRARYPDVHYLGIDRPARLRPDAHSTGDCLHIMSGAGVLEGWSHYIWHFVTREV
ncbi:hypothetical protein CC2G_009605 [Coprinopsis cinerea AmutBmut pab1-1]|nr:hypothetical protein CC2G_009605 [Coprinopsis cinerea AmutBmut pab1-1]